MDSIIQYIRQLNQASVNVREEWLDRLRDIDAGADNQVVTPEIVMSRRSGIAQHGEAESALPVTTVESREARLSRQDKGVSPAGDGPASWSETSAETQADETQPTTASHSIDVVAASGTTGDTTDSGSGPVTGDPVTTADVELFASVTGEPADTDINRPMVPQHGTDRLAHAPQLDSPAVLADILRPTIMPLRPSTDSRSGNTASRDPLTASGDAAGDSGQLVELPETVSHEVEIPGDFGEPGDSIYTNDTVDADDLQDPAAASPDSGPDRIDTAVDATCTVQPNQPQHASLPEGDRPAAATEAALPVCVFPVDGRAERYIYSVSNRQKLVDSIVDQLQERFPAGSNATVMLVGTNREIDIDSAASRIATCLAGRQVGKILLVDGNLQSRQLTSLVGLTGERGISNAFHENGDVRTLIRQTDQSSLMMIGAGTCDLADRSGKRRFAGATNQVLKEEFDYTIISGGIAGDRLADAWSSVADGVYLIVDMDESDRSDTISTVDYFRKLGARIVGCIATRA
jgi:Mrp family chromosome partitioning ATPase